ncbi:DUF1484 family protein [Cupriavidus sp. L7L]|nr:DUF1484 family protein [Cupriavidus sp. L7L]
MRNSRRQAIARVGRSTAKATVEADDCWTRIAATELWRSRTAQKGRKPPYANSSRLIAIRLFVALYSHHSLAISRSCARKLSRSASGEVRLPLLGLHSQIAQCETSYRRPPSALHHLSASLSGILFLLESQSDHSEEIHGTHCLLVMVKSQLDQLSAKVCFAD